ncbi:MAG: hypothetical protein IKW53_08185 [Clostridia bacterium]|nr:hypothetical protein [Clostridia bacterium]
MKDRMNDKNIGKKAFAELKVAQKATCILMVALAAFIAVCLVTDGMGALGNGIRTVLLGLLSGGATIIPIALVAQAVCYAEDLKTKRFAKRSAFALVSAMLFSCIEYAIFTWGSEPTFAPIQHFTNVHGGGFIGGVIGFVLTKMIGNLGVVILSIMALAIYSLFFFAEKAGSIGQAALNFAQSVKKAIVFVADKYQAYTEKKKHIKADAEQHQREVSSEELIDDEFFIAKGEASEIKIKKLGIDENASTHGLSPLVDPDKRIPEEPEVVVEEPEVIKRKRSDKPVDLSYGIEPSEATQESTVEQPVAEEPKQPAVDKFALGLDESADSVFTRDFDPFDFATSEKKAAKYASKVSSGSAVTEELDEETLYRMKADHEPDARELRMMELQRKQQEYLRRKQATQPSVASTQTPKQEAVSQPTVAQPTVAQPTVTQPANASTATPVVSNNPVERPSTPASTTSRPYTGATRQQPIKTVEFTISKGSAQDHTPPAESYPVSMTVEKATKPEESPEDIAILISKRVEQANPGYARSANDLKTYTKVVADGDDELYRQLEGISTPEPTSEPTSISTSLPETTNEATNVGSTVVEPSIQPEPTYEAEIQATEPANAETVAPSHESEAASTTEVEATAEAVEFSIEEAPAAPVVQSSQSTPIVASDEADSTAEPEFKPYTTPVESINASNTTEESTLKIERSMLPPTVEAVHHTAEAEVQPIEAPTQTENTEVEFAPVDEAEKAEVHTSTETVSDIEPVFTAVDEEEDATESDDESDDEESVEVSFDDEDDDDEDIDNGDEDEDIPEEEAYEDEGEIPPEEQNPDVIKMRGMFNCLDPIEAQSSSSLPARDESAEIVVPAEEDDDEPPFDNAVQVKPEAATPTVANTPTTNTSTTNTPTTSTPATALVAIDSGKKMEKKDKPDYSDFQFPPLDFLAKEVSGRDDNIQAEIQENADKLIETLGSFNVSASIKGVDRGPRITRYEVVPAKGVKVSSILNLQDDIALNLAAGSIRMEAPIPGKSAVGIEIPNKSSSIVRLRDLLETPDFIAEKSKTFVCIGRDVAGQPVFGDLAKMPHLLIAGATGMGKSVCINSLLISILYKARPDEVKLIMIDPKQVEFTMYNGIPHLLVPVVSDAKKAAGSLIWAVEEMERRYNLLNSLFVRSVDAYNEKVLEDPSLGEFLPKIIIVIDEFADLMLQVKDPVESLVTRIAQKARAAGIHLVIGTQRPSVNVITGVIKANVPSRISCKVMSNVDSKTVLDSAGAEKLLDKGDALYAPAGSPKPHRLQCAFVADGEVERIMKYLQQFGGGNSYDTSVMEDIERAAQNYSKKGGADRDDSDRDESGGEGYLNDRQFLEAVEIAVNTRKISTSLIQRKLSIGYGKAAKFIDIMEDLGIVGEANGQRPREVLLTPDEWREKLARSSYD